MTDPVHIRSSKLSLKFSNVKKLNNVSLFIDEYKRVLTQFIDLLWSLEKVPSLVPIEISSKITDSWLSKRAIQCAGKQASGIVRGTRKKQEKRLYYINKLKSEGRNKEAKKLTQVYDNQIVTKPSVDNIECELDERFVRMDFSNETSFDGWITLSSLGNKFSIKIPVKKTKHFNKFNQNQLLKGIRLSKNFITFNFKIKNPEIKTNGKTIGIDIGASDVISCSNGFQTTSDKHGHTLGSILKKLSRKRKGSNAYKKAMNHRDNFIKWSINQLNINDIAIIKLESIKNLRRGKKVSKFLSSWNYKVIFDKLNDVALRNGVHIQKVNPTYTSQRCSKCGWTCKRNRQGKQFKCEKCCFQHDSDLNASMNISFDLLPIGKQEQALHKNKTGFYWNVMEGSL